MPDFFAPWLKFSAFAPFDVLAVFPPERVEPIHVCPFFSAWAEAVEDGVLLMAVPAQTLSFRHGMMMLLATPTVSMLHFCFLNALKNRDVIELRHLLQKAEKSALLWFVSPESGWTVETFVCIHLRCGLSKNRAK
jgi:hypothetical protein